MRAKRFILLGIILGWGMLLLAACGNEKADVLNTKHVGVACYDQNDVFISELLECFKEACNEYNLVVTVRDAARSQKTQNDQVKELINGGCDILCVNLADRTDTSDIIDMAKKNNVKIIFFNREPVVEDLMQWDGLYYVGADAKESGVMQGELVADYIQKNKIIDRNNDGKIQYVILEGEIGHQDAIIRTESTVDRLKESGIELERLGYGIANWNRAQAQNRMSQMLSQYPEEIEVVLANNDEMALGAVEAYKKLGYSDEDMPAFFGIDGTDEGLRAVKETQISATVYNDKEGQAKAMAELADALLQDKDLDKFVFEKNRCLYLPYSKVTLENVDDYMTKK